MFHDFFSEMVFEMVFEMVLEVLLEMVWLRAGRKGLHRMDDGATADTVGLAPNLPENGVECQGEDHDESTHKLGSFGPFEADLVVFRKYDRFDHRLKHGDQNSNH